MVGVQNHDVWVEKCDGIENVLNSTDGVDQINKNEKSSSEDPATNQQSVATEPEDYLIKGKATTDKENFPSLKKSKDKDFQDQQFQARVDKKCSL